MSLDIFQVNIVGQACLACAFDNHTVFVCCVSLQRHAYEFGKSGAGHSIAWAFLRLSGLQHKQLLQGHPLKLKLQLYHYSAGTHV